MSDEPDGPKPSRNDVNLSTKNTEDEGYGTKAERIVKFQDQVQSRLW